jgi:hypothetical protein
MRKKNNGRIGQDLYWTSFGFSWPSVRILLAVNAFFIIFFELAVKLNPAGNHAKRTTKSLLQRSFAQQSFIKWPPAVAFYLD